MALLDNTIGLDPLDWQRIAKNHAAIMAARKSQAPAPQDGAGQSQSNPGESPEWPVLPGGAQPQSSGGVTGAIINGLNSPAVKGFFHDIWYGDASQQPGQNAQQVAAQAPEQSASRYPAAAQAMVQQAVKEAAPALGELPTRQVQDAGVPGAPYTAPEQPPASGAAPEPAQAVPASNGAPLSLGGPLGEPFGMGGTTAAQASANEPPSVSLAGRLKGLGGALGAIGEFAEPTPNLTAKVLTARGMEPDMALAVAQSPQLARALLPKMFAPAQFTTVGHDQFGNGIMGFVDPYRRTAEPVNLGGAQPGASGGVQDVTQLMRTMQSGLTGQQLTEKLDPTTRAEVQALLEGRTPLTNPQRAGPRYQMLFALAHQVDPKFDATVYKMRQDLRKNLEGYGKGGQEATAANTAIEHLSELSEAAEKLENVGGAWILNKPVNEVVGAFRWLTADKRPNSFNALRDLAVKEIDKFYTGTGGAAAERQEMVEQIQSTSSPQQLHSVIATMARAMGGKVQELERRWVHGMGPAVAPLEVLSRESREKIARLEALASGGQHGAPGQQTAAITATGPNGQKIVLRNGQWEPMQ